MKKTLVGVILIILGIVLGLNVLEIININIFFKGWWTLFIIIPCLIDLVSDDNENKTMDIIGIIIGFSLLLSAQKIIKFEIVLKLIIPLILIITGISLILKDKIKENFIEKTKIDNNNLDDIISIFSEQKINKKEELFKGSNIDAVFGSAILDIKEAKLEKETYIKTSSIFASITILVPEDVTIKVKLTPIFGGVSNKAKTTNNKNKIIYIESFCLFGGVDIKWQPTKE